MANYVAVLSGNNPRLAFAMQKLLNHWLGLENPFTLASVARNVRPMVSSNIAMNREVQSHSFLKDLSKSERDALSKIATRAQFKAGKPIFRQGETADRFFLIEKGRVSLDYGLSPKRHVQIQTIGPGEALGWSWLAAPYRWQFSATAIDDVTLSFFPVLDLRQLCVRDPKLGYAIMERVAQVLMERLQATRHKLRVYVQRASGDEGTQQVC